MTDDEEERARAYRFWQECMAYIAEQRERMKPNADITQARLKSWLHYEVETGVFTWLVNMGRKKTKGCRAGTINGQGYRQIKINGTLYKASRLAWLYVTGEWPDEDIDHRNRVRDDDRFENLRVATRQQNSRNKDQSSKRVNGTDEPLEPGVFKRANGTYQVQIDGIHFRTFKTYQEANPFARKIRRELHGEFAVNAGKLRRI
jgi:HNH endonuclease